MNIKLGNVSFRYNSRDVLKNIEFEIGRGITGIVGPNGSGKTTLLKCIDRILKPYKGSIFIGDKQLEDYKNIEVSKLMGYVPQIEERSFPSKVFETILLGRKPHISWSPSENDLAVVSRIISLLGLDEISMNDVNKLSGGQRQKVIIGRALAQEPNILLFDEPTASLDLKHQLELMEIIRKQTEIGTSAILSIHDLNLASRFCDTVIMLKNGEIFDSGKKEKVLNPENIQHVYGVKSSILQHNGKLLIVPD